MKIYRNHREMEERLKELRRRRGMSDNERRELQDLERRFERRADQAARARA